jgi:AraC-like DNA-binding protein
VGDTPLAYLTRWRMDTAARLLRDTGRPLSRIAEEVGYESEFSFNKAFRRARGISPGRYRRAVAETGAAAPGPGIPEGA